nr:MAG TPA: hypothetical protein [Caudoviricetes sp.]
MKMHQLLKYYIHSKQNIQLNFFLNSAIQNNNRVSKKAHNSTLCAYK